MKLENVLEELFEFTGADLKHVPAAANVLRRAGAPDAVPDKVFKRVMKAGRDLKLLGIR